MIQDVKIVTRTKLIFPRTNEYAIEFRMRHKPSVGEVVDMEVSITAAEASEIIRTLNVAIAAIEEPQS